MASRSTAGEGGGTAAYALVDGRLDDEGEGDAADAGGVVDRPSHPHTGRPSLPSRFSVPLSPRSPPGDRIRGARGAGHAGGDDASVVLTTPERWYDYYSSLYPSRHHLERAEIERRIEEEERIRIQQSGGGGGGKEGSWLWRLLLGGGKNVATESTNPEAEGDVNDDADADGRGDDGGDDESSDGPFRSSNNLRGDGMCGTSSLLDNQSIPHEARTFHRFHLASERRALASPVDRQSNRWDVALPVRRAVGYEGEDGPHYCVVGYGRIAEFPSLDSANQSAAQSSSGGPGGQRLEGANVSLTSDHLHLSALSNSNDNGSDGSGPPHDIRHCRAASIGKDCLMVSWGRGDGWIVFYRRVPLEQRLQQKQQHRGQQGKGGQQRGGGTGGTEGGNLEVGWEVVAAASPSRPVIRAATGGMSPAPYYHPNPDRDSSAEEGAGAGFEESTELSERRLYDSGMLYVTDLVPMVIDNEGSPQQQQQQTEDQQHSHPRVPSSAILAVSRLGGFVELLPLPPFVWIPSPSSSSDQIPRANDGHLPNLTASSKTTAFSTAQHHGDITALDAYRTNVDASGGWDEKRRPDGPPAEIVLCACGLGSGEEREGRENGGVGSMGRGGGAGVTFWGITAVHALQQTHEGGDELVFDLSVVRIGHFYLDNVGADSSLFLSETAADRWSINHVPPAGEVAKRKAKRRRVSHSCTVTAVAPLVSLRFTPKSSSTSIGRGGVLVAALDHNGGVSIMDCTDTVRSAEHSDPDYADDSGGDGIAPLGGVGPPIIRLMCGRELSMTIRSRGKSQCVARASQIEWWPSNDAPMGGSDGSFALATYVTLTKSGQNGVRSANALRLQRWSPSKLEGGKAGPTDVFCMPISGSPSSALLLQTSRSDRETLPFLQLTISSAHDGGTNSNNNISRHLSIRAVRKFTNPSPLISALLRRGDPSSALEVARKFGGAEHFGGRVMDECRVRLWEGEGDAEALKGIDDGVYVIREALMLEECEGLGGGLRGLTLDDLGGVFGEAIGRCEQLAGSEDEDPEWLDSGRRRLKFAIVRLGTFRLLSEHYARRAESPVVDDQELARRFLRDFRRDDLRDIASCAASMGDVDALTVILARHPVSARDRMELLDRIPLDVDAASYERLLPCCNSDSMVRFPGNDGNFASSMSLFGHLCECQGKRLEGSPDVYVDVADRDLVKLCSGAVGTTVDDVDELATWYLRRAIEMHLFTGQILPTREACGAGLLRLGFASEDDGLYELSGPSTIPDSCRGSKAVERLVYLHSATTLLCDILGGKMNESLSCEGQLTAVENFSEWRNLFTSVIQFCAMGLSDTVPFVLESSSAGSMATFQKHVARFVDADQCVEPRDTGAAFSSEGLARTLEHYMMELCLDQLRGLRRVANSTLPLSLRLEGSLSACVDFASFGFSSATNSESGLVEFAERIFLSALGVVKGEMELLTDGVMDGLWSVFELLPSTAPNDEDRAAIAGLYFRLVALQLCGNWSLGRKTFPRALWRLLCSPSGGKEGGSRDRWKRDLAIAGWDVVSLMCSGFCELAVSLHDPDDYVGHVSQGELDLLFDFVSDVDEFDKRFFSSGIERSGCLGQYLFSPLLSQHSFAMVRNLLKVRPGWFDPDFVLSVVSSFARTVATSRDDGFHVAQTFREILGPLFPDLGAEFELQQRLSDARQFMMEAMKLDAALLDELFALDCSGKPIVLVQSLVASCPQVVLLGCEFWSDESSSTNACTDASVYFSSQIRASLSRGSSQEAKNVLPPMPGALVMQLANIIGLHTSRDLLRVKQCMVDGALKMRLGPAAAAICYSMLCDAAFSRRDSVENVAADTAWTRQHEVQVLGCVVAIAKDQSFGNLQVKKEMCTTALQLFSTTEATLYHELLDVFKHLECQLLAVETESISRDTRQVSGRTDITSDFLVFRAAGFVAKQAKDFADHSSVGPLSCSIVESGNNFHERSMAGVFYGIKKSSSSDLLRLLQSSPSDKPDLGRISEIIFKWGLQEAFMPRPASALPSSPAANISVMMEIASSCLAELYDDSSASLAIDQALGEFNANKLSIRHEPGTSPDLSIQPDMSLVRRINDRGYGWNAARRAVIMTNNQGYSAALTWAVSHFSDADFDSPIYFLQSEDSVHVDQRLVDVTGQLLRSIQKKIQSKRTRDDATTAYPPREAEKKTTASPKPKKHFVSKIPSPSSKAMIASHKVPPLNLGKHPDQPRQSPRPLPHPSISLKKHHESKLPPPSAHHASPMSLNTGGKPPVKLSPIETPQSGGSRASRLPLPTSGGSMSSVEGSLGSRASIKRQVQQGKSKLGTQKLTLEDRKKLALEGKRLLDAARAKNKKVIAPPTTITTSRRAPP